MAAITAANQLSYATDVSAASSTKMDDSKGMSKEELATMLVMCGKASSSSVQDLPEWLQKKTDKGNLEAFKIMLVQKFIMNNIYFNDADVPLTMQLLKLIAKRSWTGKDGNINCPSILHVMDGLTPFAMLDLNKNQVALLNNKQEFLNRTSHVCVADLHVQPQ